jgi:hypothetical protein
VGGIKRRIMVQADQCEKKKEQKTPTHLEDSKMAARGRKQKATLL